MCRCIPGEGWIDVCMVVYIEGDCEVERKGGGRMRVAVIRRGHEKSHLCQEKAFLWMFTTALIAA